MLAYFLRVNGQLYSIFLPYIDRYQRQQQEKNKSQLSTFIVHLSHNLPTSLNNSNQTTLLSPIIYRNARSSAQQMRPFLNLSNKRTQTITKTVPLHGPRHQKKSHKYLEALH